MQFLNYVDILIGIISSYIYAIMAAFGYTEDYPVLNHLLNTFDVYFLMRIVKNFFTDYIPLGETIPERNLYNLAIRYLKNEFALDFILWFPS